LRLPLDDELGGTPVIHDTIRSSSQALMAACRVRVAVPLLRTARAGLSVPPAAVLLAAAAAGLLYPVVERHCHDRRRTPRPADVRQCGETRTHRAWTQTIWREGILMGRS